MPPGKHGNHARGRRNPKWSEGKLLSSHGYVKIRVGKTHPLADSKGYAYEHSIVWAAAGRTLPGQSELLHHRNENKTDNRLENLEVVTRTKHNEHHNRSKARDKSGKFIKKGRIGPVGHGLRLLASGTEGRS